MMMEQLPLDVRLADYAVFDSFLAGPNGVVVHALQAAASSPERSVTWLCGPADSGRTHLLQATMNQADAAGFRAAYLPVGPALPASAVEGFGTFELLCLDDIDRVAGDAAWERELFRLFEELGERGGRLVMAASAAPGQLGFRLCDLASRFASGAVFRLLPLTDEQKCEALQRRAHWRGLELPDETARFLLTRCERTTGHLFGLLDRLDRAALAKQRRLTVPFVRSVLDAGPQG